MIWHNLDQQQKVALALSVAVNALAVGILLAVGMSEPLKPPVRIKAVLLSPEDVKALQNASETDLSNPNVAEQLQTRPSPKPVISPVKTEVKPEVEPEPVTKPEPQPTAKTEPQKTTASTPEKAAKSQSNEQVDPTLAARLRAEKAVRDAKLRAAENLKKEQAEKIKQKREEQKALEEAKKLNNTKPVDSKKTDQKAKDLKKDADDARKNAEAEKKAKAEANAKAEAKAKAEEQRLKDLEDEVTGIGQTAKDNAAIRKGEIKTMVGNAKRDFESKIYRAWDIPFGSSGQKASARVTLSDKGAVLSVIVSASNPDVKASVEAAIRAAAPYPLPSDPDARQQARSFSSTFTAK